MVKKILQTQKNGLEVGSRERWEPTQLTPQDPSRALEVVMGGTKIMTTGQMSDPCPFLDSSSQESTVPPPQRKPKGLLSTFEGGSQASGGQGRGTIKKWGEEVNGWLDAETPLPSPSHLFSFLWLPDYEKWTLYPSGRKLESSWGFCPEGRPKDTATAVSLVKQPRRVAVGKPWSQTLSSQLSLNRLLLNMQRN